MIKPSPSRLAPAGSLLQQPVEHPELVVDGDAQGLKVRGSPDESRPRRALGGQQPATA